MTYNCISRYKCHIIALFFFQSNSEKKEEVVNNLNVFTLRGFMEVSIRNFKEISNREYSETHIGGRT